MLIGILQYLTAKQEIAPQAFPSVPRRFAPRNDMVIWWLVPPIQAERQTEIYPTGRKNVPQLIGCGTEDVFTYEQTEGQVYRGRSGRR